MPTPKIGHNCDTVCICVCWNSFKHIYFHTSYNNNQKKKFGYVYIKIVECLKWSLAWGHVHSCPLEHLPECGSKSPGNGTSCNISLLPAAIDHAFGLSDWVLALNDWLSVDIQRSADGKGDNYVDETRVVTSQKKKKNQQKQRPTTWNQNEC